METLPLPPEPAPVPPAPISAYRRALDIYDRIAEADRRELFAVLRADEDVLIEAKAVDERVRAGDDLPLAGMLLTVDDTFEVPTTTTTTATTSTDVPVRRLVDAGAVLLGTTPAGHGSKPAAATVGLDLADIALGAGMAVMPHVVALSPTPELTRKRLHVFAATVADGLRVLTALTDADAWPTSVRLSAGERPRVAVPGGTQSNVAFVKAVQDLLAAGAVLETVGTPDAIPPGADALLLPAGRELLDLPVVSVAGVDLVARRFEDQIALDLAAFLHGEQLKNPYPPGGIDLIVFGAHLRGQPLNRRLVELGARFRGEATTAPHYRMVVLPDCRPGVLPATDGAALTGERWTLSPAALGWFLAGLERPFTLGELELEDGDTAVGCHCAAAAAEEGRDITAFGDWRAYLRHLTATRPMSG